MTGADVRALADFLDQLSALSAKTGVVIEHYERITLKAPGGTDVKMAGAPAGDGQYELDIRDSS